MKKKLLSFILTTLITLLIPLQTNAANVKIGDITHVKGVRNNQIVGYGLVVGLPGTGDNSRSTQLTNKMLLMNLGTVIEQENYIQKGSSAAVIVTATVPPFAKNGDQIDVTVSTLADAKSLEGGVLVQTILKAPNGEAIAVAQGPISVGGVNARSGGSMTRTAITSTGRIPGGAIMERDIDTEIGVCGMGEGMSHLLSIDTIQKAYDYITVLKKHLTEEPVREFIKELNNMKRKRYDN